MDSLFQRNDIVHLATSDYVTEHLKSHKVPIYTPLVDGYIDREFFKSREFSKKDQVCYNATGGMRQTSIDVVTNLQNLYPEVVFVPIKDMSRNEVIQTLEDSKVYLEFGNLPGKEKLLREAILKDCCVVTRGDVGCGKFFNDIQILDRYKSHPFAFDNIYLIIKECFQNYQECLKDFTLYKRTLAVQETQFLLDIRRLFIWSNPKSVVN